MGAWSTPGRARNAGSTPATSVTTTARGVPARSGGERPRTWPTGTSPPPPPLINGHFPGDVLSDGFRRPGAPPEVPKPVNKLPSARVPTGNARFGSRFRFWARWGLRRPPRPELPQGLQACSRAAYKNPLERPEWRSLSRAPSSGLTGSACGSHAGRSGLGGTIDVKRHRRSRLDSCSRSLQRPPGRSGD